MKGLWKYIAPFAPDQSGAAAVLCGLKGLLVIVDAGGCAGNICGFDEPRWFDEKCAIFSAGLRDMDAILGRDERLVEKTVKVCQEIGGKFVAIIGTPVPAVIGTDYRALQRMIHRRTGMPVLTVDSAGVGYYDEGASKAYLALVRAFLKAAPESAGKTNRIEEEASGKRRVFLGTTPLDTDGVKRPGYLGMGEGLELLEDLAAAPRTMQVQVVAPSGLKAARWLKARYGIDWQAGYPLKELKGYRDFARCRERFAGKKVLIVHQQILANALREEIEAACTAQVQTASWFLMDETLRREADYKLQEEDQWIDLINRSRYDVIIGDPLFKKAIPDYRKTYISLPHFAVSGNPLTLEGFGREAVPL